MSGSGAACNCDNRFDRNREGVSVTGCRATPQLNRTHSRDSQSYSNQDIFTASACTKRETTDSRRKTEKRNSQCSITEDIGSSTSPSQSRSLDVSRSPSVSSTSKERMLKRTVSNELRYCKTSPLLEPKSSSSPKLFPKHNIFITSPTRSQSLSSQESSTHSDAENSSDVFHTRSNPSLQMYDPLPVMNSASATLAASLTANKSTSVSPPRKSYFAWSEQSQKKITGSKQNQTDRLYQDENISQILSFLFVGNIKSAYNEWLLCRLGISSIVDLSNPSKKDLAAYKHNYYPCVCMSSHGHSRARLQIDIQDSPKENISAYFRDINIFIEGARKKDKKVLINSYYGTSRGPAVVMQYLMSYGGHSFSVARDLVSRQRPETKINEGFEATLKKLETSLIRSKRFQRTSSEVAISDVTINLSEI